MIRLRVLTQDYRSVPAQDEVVGIDQKTSHGFSFLINMIHDFRNTEARKDSQWRKSVT
jgi:hypothetical protein